ncbi:hypothetical protein PVK74_04510 [Micromonospora chalcea]|uniref:hypothetical protein n=2 Tax=Micromonospora chalcea TaxID=1874 RepID=UPI002378A65E|nr:hypothetical protein [Micromonospora chalcea]WDQ01062.1 hypothetical protein PVK74_04510 [Micromonospora chalcea]
MAATRAGVTGRYLAAVRDDTGQPTAYLPPCGKRYPGATRRPLRWPGPGSVPLGDGCLDRLSAMLLGYAPRRAETITLAGLSALTGAPSDTPTPSRLLPGWHTLRRSVPSGGAFHPNEIYLAWAGSPDLAAGVYHYDPPHHCLELLRPGSPAARLDRLLGAAAAPRHALLLTHRPWKNTSKYGAFGYRLGIVDSGVLLAQLLTSPVDATPRLDLDPALAGELLGLDAELEATYAAIEFPAHADVPGTPLASAGPPPATGLDHDRLGHEAAHPSAVALHRARYDRYADAEPPSADRLPADGVPARRLPADRLPVGPAAGRALDLPPARPLDLVAAAARRASAANLGPGLTAGQVAGILACAAGRAGSPALAALARQPLYPELWCLARAVDGIPADAYRYQPHHHRLVPTGPPGAADDAAAYPHRVDRRMVTRGATLYLVHAGSRPVDQLSPASFHRLHLLAGVALHLAGLAATATGAASRALGGLTADAVAARLGLPDGASPLTQLLVGTPAPRPGVLAAHLTEGNPHG